MNKDTFTAQRVRIAVELLLPIQKGMHVTHIAERIEDVLRMSFEHEFAEAGLNLDKSIDVWWHGCIMGGLGPDDEEYRLATGLTRADAVYFLRNAFPHDLERVEEYIGEAEHQEGNDYWENSFVNWQELSDDFKLYSWMATTNGDQGGWHVNNREP